MPIGEPETLVRRDIVGEVRAAVDVVGDPSPGSRQLFPLARAKVDFGIAKVISDGSERQVVTTAAEGQRVLTPEYASPEQLRGDAITTASDVYSLGVVLYELLVGSRPYEVDSRTPIEIERSIADSRIAAPSTLFARTSSDAAAEHANDQPTPSNVASARGITVPKLRRRLQGDLDTIVLKALRKDPARRYASVEALVEDLRRHRIGLPIEARPESMLYRSGKFVERYRVGVSIAAVVTFLLIGAVGVSLNLARQKAMESVKAQQVTEFMASMFSSSDPDRTQGTQITVLELLEEGAGRIESELAGQPEVQAELMEVMGQVYMKFGLYEKSETLHRAALANRRSFFGERHPLVARSMHRTAVTLRGQARWVEAEACWTRRRRCSASSWVQTVRIWQIRYTT
ncbi:MAG TPA: tetratricopeptide repeat-containing protein kinase family protein [Rhodothermales bacterium]|nr:tetratricopeptide repeat-containing protein kinase family protein [Rhodothermales bacterium]